MKNPTCLNICFVSDTIHTYFNSELRKGVGGAERQQCMIAKRLRNEGFQVSVLTLDLKDYTSPQIIDGVEIWKEIPDLRGSVRAPLKVIGLLRALRKVNADLYYVRGNDFLCIVTSLYCQLTDSKFVYAVANDSNIDPNHLSERNFLFTKIYLSSISSADAVTVLTPYQKKILARDHGIRSTVVPCGYDIPSADELLSHEHREFILWVGRLDPDQKRPERYLRLAENNPGLPFIMIGPPDNDDHDRSYFNKIKEKADSIENLKFIDFVPPDEIHEYFRKASVLVNTSDYEGFGNVFLEAWRYATPVVTLKYTLHGLINERNVGVQATSIEDLSRIVEELHMSYDRRSEMGWNGRALIKEKFSIEAVIDQYRQIFSDI